MHREGESSHSAAKQPPLGAAAPIKGSNAQIVTFAKSRQQGHLDGVNGPKWTLACSPIAAVQLPKTGHSRNTQHFVASNVGLLPFMRHEVCDMHAHYSHAAKRTKMDRRRFEPVGL
jgi:hypothetical protein